MRGSRPWLVAASACVVLCAATSASAQSTTSCLTGGAAKVDADAAAIATARAAIDAACPCDEFDGTQGKGRAAYIGCAARVRDALLESGSLRSECAATVRKMTNVSTCGTRPAADAVVCVREVLSTGVVSCSIRSESRCKSTAQYVETACSNATHCADAADTNRDLRIGAPGDSGACAAPGATPQPPAQTPRPTATPRPTPTPTPRPTSGSPDPFPTGPGGAELARLVNEYRVSKGKPALPLSKAMMATAGAHVADLSAHPGTWGGSCNLHSWSNFGAPLYTGCCYTADHAQAACMWRKPSEISSGLGFARYPGNGYEIAFAGGGATPQQVLDAFKGSAPHNAVILNTGSWEFLNPYPAMGAAMLNGYAVVWFGDAADPWR